MKVNLISLKEEDISIEGMEDVGLYSISAYLNNKKIDTKINLIRENNLECDSIIENQPDLIIISVYNIYPCVRDKFDDVVIVKLLVSQLKCKIPNVSIAIAGFPASNYWKEIMLEIKELDFVIRGECEETAYMLVQSLCHRKNISKVDGIAYRDRNGNLILNNKREPINDLNLIPFPIREDFDRKIATIATSRGCKRNCNFCTVNDFWGKWRGRNVHEIIKEISYLYNEFGIKRYNFIDESFEDSDNGIGRWMEFSTELKRNNVKIAYYIQMRAETYELISEKQIDELIDSGLCGISIGVETFSKDDRIIYGKYASVEQNVECIKFVKRRNIALSFNMINFNPYSTFNSLKENLYWLNELGYAFDVTKINSYYQAQKGTRLYSKIVKDSLIKEPVNSIKILSMYNYSYVDSRIGCLAEFLKKYFEKEKVHHRIHYYGHEFSFLVSYIKNFGKDNIKLIEAVNDYYEHVNGLFVALNKIYSDWFSEMLTMTYESWNRDEAIDICNKYFKINDIGTFVKIFDRHSFILLKNVRKIDANILY